jgi:hypothetical protein
MVNNSKHRITLRSVLIGLFFVVLLCAVTPYNNSYLQNTRIAGNHLPVASIFVLLFLVFFVNVPLRKLRPRLALTSGELITIWVMLITALVVPGMSFLEALIPQLAGISYFATPENEWAETLHRNIPDWLFITDKIAVNDFYRGTQTRIVPWSLWIKPLCIWGLFMLVFYFTLYCLSTIIRKQWTERERFAYPLIQVPLGIASDPDPGSAVSNFFKNRLLLLGMSIPVLFHLINGLHSHFPAIPEIPRAIRLFGAFTEKPFHVLGQYPALQIMIYFSVIGITYLLHQDISLSLWVFFLLIKVEHVILTAVGASLSAGYFHRQIMGGYLVFIPGLIWISRRHLADVFHKAFSRKGAASVDDSGEPLSYRAAVLGFLLGSITLVFFNITAGVAPWIAVVIVILLIIMSIVLSWLVTSAGLLRIQAPFMPWQYIHVIASLSVMDARSLALCSFHRSIFREWREFVMPHYLHSFRAGEETKINTRRLLPVIGLATIVAYVVSCYAILTLTYDKGGLSLNSYTYRNIPGWVGWISRLVQYRSGRDSMDAFGMALGAIVTTFLLIMRHSFIWWPLHPIGFILGGSWPLYHLWSCVLIGWIVKRSILKFGGLGMYRRFRFFFLGLIFGEYAMVGFWMVVSYFTQTSYSALPT